MDISTNVFSICADGIAVIDSISSVGPSKSIMNEEDDDTDVEILDDSLSTIDGETVVDIDDENDMDIVVLSLVDGDEDLDGLELTVGEELPLDDDDGVVPGVIVILVDTV